MSESEPISTAAPQESHRVRRKHREAQIKHAYQLQRDAAIRGAAIWTVIGGSGVILAHHLFPPFRQQTLAFKGFLTSGFAIFGLVVGADTVLLNHEGRQRTEENLVRRRAALELGRAGIVPSETEIERWKEETRAKALADREQRIRQEQTPSEIIPAPPPETSGSTGTSLAPTSTGKDGDAADST